MSNALDHLGHHWLNIGTNLARCVLILQPLLIAIAIGPMAAAPAQAAEPPHPVVFVHGLTGSVERSWTDALEFFAAQPDWGNAVTMQASDLTVAPGSLYAINFSDFDAAAPSQNLTFAQQGGELAAAVATILASNPGDSRVILVAHSMGGLAARTYMEDLGQLAMQAVDYDGDVAALITIGTPHLGTPLADTCTDLEFLCGPVVDFFDTPLDLDSVALDSLRTDSGEITALNAAVNVAKLPTDIVYRSVVGNGQSVPVVLDTDSDRVVPASSQDLSNVPGTDMLDHAASTIDYSDLDGGAGVGHLAESSDPIFFDIVLSTINALAVCGDGAIHGSETCDDGNTDQADGCSSICLIDTCGDPIIDGGTALTAGTVTASDALFVLRAAVGVAVCADCVCDVNENGSITASDALAVLQAAVGAQVTLSCSSCAPLL